MITLSQLDEIEARVNAATPETERCDESTNVVASDGYGAFGLQSNAKLRAAIMLLKRWDAGKETT